MKPTKPRVIIIRGAPGAGKTEVSKALATYFPDGARIEVDSLRKMVISVKWTNQNEHINMLGVTARLARDFLSLGICPVIIVDTFSGDKLHKFIDDVRSHSPDAELNLFGLFVNHKVLAERLNERDATMFKDFSISDVINNETVKNKHPIETQFDTTASSSLSIAQRIYKIIYQQREG